MNLLITEVTEMQRDNYCVAGWSADEKRMVRPLPNGDHWRANLLERRGLVPGTTISVASRGTPHGSAFPHRTEDAEVIKASIRVIGGDPARWFGSDAPPAAATLSEAFEGHLRHNREWHGTRHGLHVVAGVQARSLWAVAIARHALSFSEDSFKDGPKNLKAVFSDGIGQYNVAVTCRALKEAWRAGGLDALPATLPRRQILHVRLGLARPYGHPPDKCYVLLNGVNG